MTDEALIRFLKGNAGRDEIREIDNWLKDNPQNMDYLKQLHERLLLIDMWTQSSGLEDKKSIDRILDKTVRQKEKNMQWRTRFYIVSAVAATITLFILFYSGWNHYREELYQSQQELWEQYRGTGVLLLSDGQKVSLDQFENEIIVSGDTLRVNHLIYVNNQSDKGKNLICAKRGSVTKVHLNEGTEVYLNAGSIFEFPQLFTESARKVELDGEAFLTVSKQKGKTFVVKTAYKNVEVLGTMFNVHAYTAEDVFSTVLVEGSIAVTSEKDRTLITPEQMYVYYKKRMEGEVVNTDPAQYTSWKDKEIRFQQLPLKEIIRRISTFYGNEVCLSDPELGNYKLTGTLSLKPEIYKTLNTLFLTLPHGESLKIENIGTRKLLVK